MRYADAMAFPIPQHLLMQHSDEARVDPLIRLNACHVTSVPPFVTEMPAILREHAWFLGRLADRDEGQMPLPIFFGLQCPPTGATERDLLVLKGMGIRFLTLAYEIPTEYGGGFATPDEPLTKRGEWLLNCMLDLGLVLDLSHAGHRTARDAIAFIGNSASRIVATHTGCSRVYNHQRNLPDDIIKAIADDGGFVGLITQSWMLDAEDNSFQPFLTHLRHLLDIIPMRSVCMGTDGVYTHLDREEGRERFEKMRTRIDPRGNFRPRFPEEPSMLNCAHRMTVLNDLLEASGFDQRDRVGILGENLIRFFEEL